VDISLATALLGSAATLTTAIVSATVALTIYRRGERTQRVEGQREQQRQSLVRMLDTVDAAVRSRLALSLVRGLRNPNTDLLLAVPKLLIEMPAKDLPVATWTAAQVQCALQTVGKKPFIGRMATIKSQLIAWHRGDLPTSWFTDSLQETPYQVPFRIPKRTRAGAFIRDALESAYLFGVVAILWKAGLVVFKSSARTSGN
jgi:hypothetical protein